MPDTTIFKDPTHGWYDRDEPNKYYAVRHAARAARRNKHAAAGQLKASIGPAVHVRRNTINLRRANMTIVGLNDGSQQPAGQVTLSGLQQKLFDRLTTVQNVSADDALEIISNNGYNKAASYGHMRAAGSTHAEAKIVISLGHEDLSVTYGKTRADGFNHTDALTKALKD